MQANRDPLPSEAMAEIFEDTKDMGVLIGKGGLYGQVGEVEYECTGSGDVVQWKRYFRDSLQSCSGMDTRCLRNPACLNLWK